VEQKTLNYSKRILKDKTRTFVLIVLANKSICCPFIFLFDIHSSHAADGTLVPGLAIFLETKLILFVVYLAIY